MPTVNEKWSAFIKKQCTIKSIRLRSHCVRTRTTQVSRPRASGRTCDLRTEGRTQRKERRGENAEGERRGKNAEGRTQRENAEERTQRGERRGENAGGNRRRHQFLATATRLIESNHEASYYELNDININLRELFEILYMNKTSNMH